MNLRRAIPGEKGMLVRRLMLQRKQTMQPDNRDTKLLLQAQQRQQDQRTKTKKTLKFNLSARKWIVGLERQSATRLIDQAVHLIHLTWNSVRFPNLNFELTIIWRRCWLIHLTDSISFHIQNIRLKTFPESRLVQGFPGKWIILRWINHFPRKR